MQKALVAATFAAVLGMGGAASAADIYTGSMKDAPVYAPAASWTGFYVGVGIGGGSATDDLKGSLTKNNIDPSLEINGLGGEGVVGTVEVGYDRQFGRFVGGIFFDYDFTSVSSDIKLSAPNFNYKATFDLDDSWSVGGRFGYLINNETLLYGLVAYTQGDFGVPAGLSNPTRDGYTLGGGLETRLGGAWFLKGEYRYTQLSTETLYDKNFGNYNLNLTDQTDIQSARLVLSYKADIFSHDLVPLK
ncbi:MAG: outer membrane protein [Rhodomicrobium sp.]